MRSEDEAVPHGRQNMRTKAEEPEKTTETNKLSLK